MACAAGSAAQLGVSLEQFVRGHPLQGIDFGCNCADHDHGHVAPFVHRAPETRPATGQSRGGPLSHSDARIAAEFKSMLAKLWKNPKMRGLSPCGPTG